MIIEKCYNNDKENIIEETMKQETTNLMLLLNSLEIDGDMILALTIWLKDENKIQEAMNWILKEGKGKETIDQDKVISNLIKIAQMNM